MQRRARGAAPRVPAAWITGPSASGSENGTPSSTQVGAAVGVGLADRRASASRSGKPPIRYGISAARLVRAPANAAAMRSMPGRSIARRAEREHLGEVLVAAAGEADQVELASRPAFASTQATACEDSSAGMIPSSSREPLERGERLGVGDRLVARAAGVAQVRVLGAGAGVVEPGRDRVRLEDLAVLVLHDRRVGAVQDAAAARRRVSGAPWRPVSIPSPAASTPISSTSASSTNGDERCRSRWSRRRRRRSRASGSRPVALEHLRARLVADHALQVAHERRERRRADARADHVVGVADVGDPVADRRRARPP